MPLLEILGPTAVPTIVCLLVGLLLLLIEMFTPGVGVPGALGLVSLIAVIVMQLGWGSPVVATYITAGVLIIIIVSILLVIRSLQKGRLSKSFLVLNDAIDASSTANGDAARQELLGKVGVSITALRPSGIAEIGGARLDVMTSGEFIAPSTAIEVTDVKGLHILVRAAANQDHEVL